MAVSLHGQSSTVYVSKPARDGWDINSGLNAGCGKKMAKVVVGDAFVAGVSSRVDTLGAGNLKSVSS